MRCPRCGSEPVYPLQHVYLRGASSKVLTWHECWMLDAGCWMLESGRVPDGIFTTNYLNLPLDLLDDLLPP